MFATVTTVLAFTLVPTPTGALAAESVDVFADALVDAPAGVLAEVLADAVAVEWPLCAQASISSSGRTGMTATTVIATLPPRKAVSCAFVIGYFDTRGNTRP
jgi:hypothetical protein